MSVRTSGEAFASDQVSLSGAVTVGSLIVTGNVEFRGDFEMSGDEAEFSMTGDLPAIALAQAAAFTAPGCGMSLIDGIVTVGALANPTTIDDIGVKLPSGTLAAPSLRWNGSNAGTGLSAEAADAIIMGRIGVAHQTMGNGLETFNVDLGDTAMGAGKALTLDDGTGAAAKLPLRFRSSLTTGWYCSTVDQLSQARAAALQVHTNASGMNVFATLNPQSAVVTVGSVNVGGALVANGSFRALMAAAKTADYTSLSTDFTILMNVSGGGVLTLVASPAAVGIKYEVWNMSANALTITAQGSHTINGGSAAGSVTIAAGAMAILTYVATNAWRTSEPPAA